MFLRRAGRTLYLYVQRPSRQGFTVINVTKPGHPKLVKRVPLETLTVMGSGLMVTETPDQSRNVGTSPAEGTRTDNTGPEPVHVLTISDPDHPLTVQHFSGVTSVLPDDARGLIYVANREGIWVLSHQQALRRHECSSSDAISNMPDCD
ncbi:MAG: hypothetical protein WBX03_09435 [Terriglobales bacterium]